MVKEIPKKGTILAVRSIVKSFSEVIVLLKYSLQKIQQTIKAYLIY